MLSGNGGLPLAYLSLRFTFYVMMIPWGVVQERMREQVCFLRARGPLLPQGGGPVLYLRVPCNTYHGGLHSFDT